MLYVFVGTSLDGNGCGSYAAILYRGSQMMSLGPRCLTGEGNLTGERLVLHAVLSLLSFLENRNISDEMVRFYLDDDYLAGYFGRAYSAFRHGIFQSPEDWDLWEEISLSKALETNRIEFRQCTKDLKGLCKLCLEAKNGKAG